MKIQIWSDFRCPFCYIGKRNLEEAIAKSGKNIEVEMMSYELDPSLKAEKNFSVYERLANARRVTIAQAKEMYEQVAKKAKEVGLNYNVDQIIDANTFAAHKVLQLAKQNKSDAKFAEIAMAAYFTEGKDLEDINVLIELGEKVGLTKEDIVNTTYSDEFGLTVKQDHQWANSIGVRGVPHFVINDTVAVSGAQSAETFLGAIDYAEKLSANANSNNVNEGGGVCSDDGCEV